MPAMAPAAGPPAARGEAYYPTDGVLDWGKFVVCDAVTKRETVYEWLDNERKYVRKNAVKVGQKVVLGEFKSPDAMRYNGLKGYVRSEQDGKYTVFCDGSDAFPHGAVMTCEASNLFVYGDDGMLYQAQPNADRAALEESENPQYIDNRQHARIMAVIQDCNKNKLANTNSGPPKVFPKPDFMFPQQDPGDMDPIPSEYSPQSKKPTVKQAAVSGKMGGVVGGAGGGKQEIPTSVSGATAVDQKPASARGPVLIPDSVPGLDFTKIAAQGGNLVKSVHETMTEWFNQTPAETPKEVGIPRVESTPRAVPAQGLALVGGVTAANEDRSRLTYQPAEAELGMPMKSAADLQLEAEIAAARASLEKAQAEYEETKRQSEVMALLSSKKKNKRAPRAEGEQAPASSSSFAPPRTSSSLAPPVVNDSAATPNLPVKPITSIGEQLLPMVEQLPKSNVLSMPDLAKYRLSEDLLRSQKGLKQKGLKPAESGEGAPGGTATSTLSSKQLPPNSAGALDQFDLFQHFQKQKQEAAEAQARVQASLMSHRQAHEELHRRFQTAISPVDSTMDVAGRPPVPVVEGGRSAMQVLNPNPAVVQTGPILRGISPAGISPMGRVVGMGDRPKTSGDAGHLVPSPRETHGTVHRHWGTHILAGMHKAAMNAKTRHETGVHHHGASEFGSLDGSRNRSKSERPPASGVTPEHAAQVPSSSLRSRSEAPTETLSGNWRVTRDPDTNRTIFLPADAPSPEKHGGAGGAATAGAQDASAANQQPPAGPSA